MNELKNIPKTQSTYLQRSFIKEQNNKRFYQLLTFFLAAFLMAIALMLMFGNKSEIKAEIIKVQPVQKCDSIPVTITIYNPTVNQCDSKPFETSDGSIIDPLSPQRWIGGSRDIVKLFGYGAKLNLIIPNAPYLNGEYILHDTDSGKLHRHIDILISNPKICRIEGKWKGFILIKL
jgi:hypothetical protein